MAFYVAFGIRRSSGHFFKAVFPITQAGTFCSKSLSFRGGGRYGKQPAPGNFGNRRYNIKVSGVVNADRRNYADCSGSCIPVEKIIFLAGLKSISDIRHKIKSVER